MAKTIEELEAQLETLTKSLDTIQNSMGALVQSQTQLQETVKSVQNAPAPINEQKKEEELKNPFEGKDIETLSNQEMIQGMTEVVKGVMSKTLREELTPLNERINNLDQTTARTTINQQYKQLKEQHKDTDKWVEEIKALANDYPKENLESLYQLARSRNPDKAAKLDSELNPPDKEESKPSLESLFGGMSEGSGAVSENEKDQRKDASFDEASERAWEETEKNLQSAAG